VIDSLQTPLSLALGAGGVVSHLRIRSTLSAGQVPGPCRDFLSLEGDDIRVSKYVKENVRKMLGC
jgi:hypothetical protein